MTAQADRVRVINRMPSHVRMIHDHPYFLRSSLLPVAVPGLKVWNRSVRDWIVG